MPLNELKLGGDFLSYSTRSAEFWYGSYNMPEGDKYNDAWDEYDTMSNYSLYAQDKINIIPKKLVIENDNFTVLRLILSNNDILLKLKLREAYPFKMK